MNHLSVSTWASINEGCPISCSVSGSNLAHLMLGDNQLELNLDAESLRALVAHSTAALAEMDAQFKQEEAARAIQERRQLVEVSA
jgi:hypothetical protein